MVKVGMVSLGCPKNQVDSEYMLGLLEREGFKLVDPAHAQVLIISTCAFIRAAVEESIECILEASEKKPKRKILVTGCLPQRYGKELVETIPEIDYAIGVGKYASIVDFVNKVVRGEKGISVSLPTPLFPATRRRLLSPSHYAYLKVADGCSNKCSYCVIPSLRGEYRSRKVRAIIEEAEELSDRGVKELILVAQDTAFYGHDMSNRSGLARLLGELSEIHGIEWIRILYLHPAHISSELVDAIAASGKICKYLDIPIQHVSDRILARMRRGVSGNQIRLLIDTLKKKIPGLTLRTTVMVGFPGEKDVDFGELFDFIQETKFGALGIFRYSPEEETDALRLGLQVEEELVDERVSVLQEAQREISLEKNLSLSGEVQKVIVDERIDENKLKGRTEFQAPDIDGVTYLEDPDLRAGDFTNVTIIGADDYDLFGCRGTSGNCHSVLKRERDSGSGNPG